MQYPTDLTDNQWQYIKKTMNLKDRKRKIFSSCNLECADVSDKNRLPMANVANDFPNWQLVYYYYSKWSDTEDFDLLLSKLREKVRLNNGQNKDPSLGIMDSQSVKWGNNSLKSFDGNKR